MANLFPRIFGRKNSAPSDRAAGSQVIGDEPLSDQEIGAQGIDGKAIDDQAVTDLEMADQDVETLKSDENNDKTPANSEVPTVPLGLKTKYADAGETAEAEIPGDSQLDFGYAQSVGRQRDHNEDALLAISTVLSSNSGQTTFGLFIVADGMGGHKHGEVASEMAARTMASQIIQKLMLARIGPQLTPPKQSIQEIMDHSVQEAHRLISKEAPGSGTTLTVLLLLDNHLTIAHVGDSRAYMVHPDGQLQPLTRDHSLVMRMLELGQLTEDEAAIHPQRNVLYRALGQGEAFAPDITTSTQPEAGFLMLCSDGLWGVLPKEVISQIIRESASPQIASQKLVDAANDAGGPDNISVILIRLPG